MSLPQSEVESHYIGELVMRALRNIDEVAYVRFASVYRHFKDVEAFINEINKMPAKETEPEGEEKPAAQGEATAEDAKPEESRP
jgi:transcriptional repressor NrdR